MLLGYVGGVDLMVLNADGTATVSARPDASVVCARALHTKGAGNDVILESSASGSGSAKLFQFRTPAENQLDLVDSAGNVISFARQDAVPSGLGCSELQVLARSLEPARNPRLRAGSPSTARRALVQRSERTGGLRRSVDRRAGATLDLPGVIAAAAGAGRSG